MTIIVGAGQYGLWIKEKFCEFEQVLFYDNDRRKWGTYVAGTRVISLEELLKLVESAENKVIIGSRSLSVEYFVKDVLPKCPVYKVENEILRKVSVKDLVDFKFDNTKDIGEKNLESYFRQLDKIKKSGNMKAYNHASKYIEFKQKHICLPEIYSIEFTNECNLKCPNCPNENMTFHKGFMTDEVFEATLPYLPPYQEDTISVHCMGEPLLHPKLITYLNELADRGINICISTNGILLDEALARELLSVLSRVNRAILYISFHTSKSVENWLNFLKLYEGFGNGNIEFFGQVLEHNDKEAHKWLEKMGVTDFYNHPHIRHITSHSFGGNVISKRKEYMDIEVNNRIRNCYYLRNNKVAVLWDGSIKSCCYDSNATQKCGSIFDFERTQINQMGYPLCKCCDPDWTTGWQ